MENTVLYCSDWNSKMSNEIPPPSYYTVSYSVVKEIFPCFTVVWTTNTLQQSSSRMLSVGMNQVILTADRIVLLQKNNMWHWPLDVKFLSVWRIHSRCKERKKRPKGTAWTFGLATDVASFFSPFYLLVFFSLLKGNLVINRVRSVTVRWVNFIVHVCPIQLLFCTPPVQRKIFMCWVW